MRMRLVLKAPARPRFEVTSRTAARFGPPLAGLAGCRSSGNRSASSGVIRSPITSASARAYGRAPTTRSCARLSLEVETISIVRVTWRVLSIERIRRRSARVLAITS